MIFNWKNFKVLTDFVYLNSKIADFHKKNKKKNHSKNKLKMRIAQNVKKMIKIIVIFDEDKNLTKEALAKVELVRELNRQRDISKKIIAELKSNDLLIKKELKININNEEKTILSEFYIIDIQKFVQLDDETVASWARKGWMGILDAHLKSIVNFEKILRLNSK